MVNDTNGFHRLFFKAFSNQTRYKIINLLQKKPLTVGEIAQKLNFEQSRVSHNLRCLEQCGFVSVEKNGNFRKYALDKETIVPMLLLVKGHLKKYKKRLEYCEVLSK